MSDSKDVTCVAVIFPVAANFSNCSFIFVLSTSPQAGLLSGVVSSNPREITIQTLIRDPNNSGFVESLLNKNLEQSRLSGKDRALTRELTLGIARWRLTLEWLAQRKLRVQPPESVLLLICLGLYQLFWMRVPQHAAVFETVELCRIFDIERYKTLINAILRGYSREIDATRQLLEELRQKDPALACSHPEWLYERWKNQWGAESALELMDWNNTIPQPYLRANTLKTEVNELLASLRIQGVEVEKVTFPFLTEQILLKLPSVGAPHQIQGYEEGLFYIQDPATLLAVQSLNPQPGERVLDQCAAPGGKTTYIAQSMKNQGSIVAVDITERLGLIRENCNRLGLGIVQLVSVRDFQTRPSEPEFDRVLLDVPCSNTGVLRRRLEARYRLNLRELGLLKETQANLLESVAPRLKPGGTLVYSTCSLDSEENEGQVSRFIESHPEFELLSSKLLLPHVEKTDGAFVSVLKKK